MEPGKLPDRAADRVLTHRSLLIVGVFASTVVLLVLVWYLIDVLLLVFAAVLLAIILRAPTDWLARHTGLWPSWALVVVILGIVALLGVAGWLFGATVSEQMGQLTRRIPEIIGDITKRLEQYAWIIQRIQPEKLLEGSPEFLGKGIQVITATFGAVAGFVIVIVLCVFLAAQPGLYVQGAVQLVLLHKRKRAEEVLLAVGRILQWWLVGQLVLMLMVGLLTGIGLLLLGVPLALALLTGLLNFIPYLGPILAAVPAILVALAESPLLAGYVLVLYIGI